MSILPHHLSELRASGLTDATIAEAGIYSETSAEKIAALLGRRRVPKRSATSIVYPFIDADGRNGYYRVKPDVPRTINGKPVKYESPVGRANEIYFPPGVAKLLGNPEAELLLTEGEKKSLKATQEGFPCIGLVGVFGWKDAKNERLLPAMERIAWHGRRVFIVFDSDAATNANVRDAEARLAKNLTDRGAVVRIVRLPEGEPDADGKPRKIGLDDFLLAQGERCQGPLRKMLDEAQEPEPVIGLDEKETANNLDPAQVAEAMLAAETTDGLPTVRYWRGTWLRWSHGSYQEVAPAEIRARTIRWLNGRYRRLSQRITGDVIDQLKAQAMLWGNVDPPAWLGDKHPWPAEEILAAKNCLVHLPSLVAGENCTTGNRSDRGEERWSSFAAEFGVDGLGQPVECVAVLAATGLDHR